MRSSGTKSDLSDAGSPELEPTIDKEQQRLPGRIRRWNAEDSWGFVYLQNISADVFLDGEPVQEDVSAFKEDDLVLCKLITDEHALPSIGSVRKANPGEYAAVCCSHGYVFKEPPPCKHAVPQQQFADLHSQQCCTA